ncbi:hypothetical protein KKA14_00060 [bacterium]|nr:hypothetical protein [bacterium]
MNFQNTILKEIDLSDHRYFLPHINKPPLHWEEDIVLHNPVWLQKKSDDTYRIVDGFLVIESLINENRIQSIPAQIFSKDTSPLHLWKLRIAKRQQENNLSILGLFEGLLSLMTLIKSDTLPIETVQLLRQAHIPEQEISREKLLLIREKSNHIHDFTQTDQLTYKELKKLSSFETKELALLNQLLYELDLKGNKLLSMLQLIDELDRGYRLSLSDILKNSEIQNILENMPAHQRYKCLKSKLMEFRWPELSRLQLDWEKTIGRLAFPSQIRIVNDPYFEADDIQFVISASSIEQFKSSIDQIQEKWCSTEFKDLFNFV